MEQEQKLLEDIENRINECEHREKYLTGREEQLNVLLAEIIEKSRKLEQLLKDKQTIKDMEQQIAALNKQNEVLQKENEKLSFDRTALLNRLLKR
jgi:CII-binding regulator of phage lambda lysogenization HflD